MLYIVATPIGNLEDISKRAIDVLAKSDIILAEDTRVTSKLLSFYNIKNKKIIPFYDEVEERKSFEVLKYLSDGMEVVLVSDAGTPLLSDPGYKLVNLCQKKGIKYTSIPGASAVINALILSGLKVDKFCFIGFLPKKDSKRLEKLESAKNFEGSKIVFESPRRLGSLIKDIKTVYGSDTKVSICREMTKMYESAITGNIEDIEKKINSIDNRGEITVVFI